jgi:hypothetical protein
MAFSSTSLRGSLITFLSSVISIDPRWLEQSDRRSGAEDFRLGGRELFVGKRSRGVQLREMLDLVCRVCRWWCIAAVIDRLLVVLVLRLPFGAVMSNCPSRYRSSNESSAS